MTCDRDIGDLARDALRGLGRSEDLTDRVFLKIERQPGLFRRYENLVESCEKQYVHQRLGHHVKAITGATSIRRDHSPPGRLPDSYTRLARPKHF